MGSDVPIRLNDSGAAQSAGTSGEIPRSFRCHMAIVREDEGDFSVLVLNLPGAGSCGETKEEALNNAREATAAVIRSYLDENTQIPWKEPGSYEIPASALQQWVLVNA